MAKCLVTGGAGFIGSHVVETLAEDGHEIVVFDDLSTGSLANIWDIKGNIIFLAADICDVGTWQDIAEEKPFDYVFHLAALARIQPSIDDPVGSNEVNLIGTLRVLEYCRKSKAKIIFSGSSSIYEGNEPELGWPTSEIGDKNPKSPYAMQKLMCEQYIRLYKKLYGLDYAVLRYFNVFGERQILDGAYAAVIGIFLDQKSRGDKLTITNDGEQRRDFTYVKDVARANVMAMDWHGTFNIGTGKNYSINDIAKLVGGKTKRIGKREGEARVTLADNSKALGMGWKPTKNVEEWLHALVSG